MSAPKTCATCGATLGRKNRSGYCRNHLSAAQAQDPAWREKQRSGAKRALHANPVRLDAARARMCARNRTPEHRAWAADRAREMKLHEIGHRFAHTPEAQAKRSVSSIATKLAWCPPHLRDDYRALIRVKKLRAAEAREIILAQDAAEVAAVRRRMASYMEGVAA